MKIEFTKEVKINDNPWYGVYLNGKYMAGSYDMEKALKMYESIKENPSENGKFVLKSEEINVTSNENN